jgi:hypothetical protein
MVLGTIKKEVITDAVWFENVMLMRDDAEGAYGLFCEHVLSHVVGRDVWKRLSPTHTVSQIATVSDEAFALLLLENSWEMWVAVATEQRDVPSPKYSMRGPGTKKYQGWTEEGIARFNELFDEVEEDRRIDKGIFEEAFKTFKLGKAADKQKKRKQISTIDPERPVVTARIEQPRAELADIRAKKDDRK